MEYNGSSPFTGSRRGRGPLCVGWNSLSLAWTAGIGNSQVAEPRQLREDELLERPARDLDPEVPEARDLDGLGQRRIRLQRRGRSKFRPPFLGLSKELRPVRGRALSVHTFLLAA